MEAVDAALHRSQMTMTDHNPYAPPTADPGSGSPAEPLEGRGKRSRAEILVLASLIASVAFLGYSLTFGSMTAPGYDLLVPSITGSFVGLGCLSLWLLALRRPFGPPACTLFYGIQLISVTLESGVKVEFSSLPTLYFRLFGDRTAPVSLNVVALLLFAVSVAVWKAYRPASDHGQPSDS